MGSSRPALSVQALSGGRSFDSADRAEVSFGRPESLKVFVSSVMRDGSLASERAATADVVDEFPGMEPWLWERNASAGPYSSVSVCLGQARTSDILVLIVGDDITDITEREWRAAQENGAACVLLRKASSSPSAKLAAFIEAERGHGIDAEFAEDEDLRRELSKALRACVTEGVRGRRRNRRLSSTPAGPTTHLLEAGVERAQEHYTRGSAATAAEVLAELDVLLDVDTERPEGLEIVTGLVLGAAGRSAEAVTAYRRILSNPTSTDHGIAVAHQNMGLEAMRVGDLRRARHLMRQALDLYVENDDWFGVLQMLLNWATLSFEEGKLDRAAQAVDTAESLLGCFAEAMSHQRAAVLGARGHLAVQAGDLEGGLALHRRSYRLSDAPDALAVSAQNVGAVYRDLGRQGLARKWSERALEHAIECSDLRRIEEVHRLLGLIAADADDLDRAITEFELARVTAERMGDLWQAATLAADIGAFLVKRGDPNARSRLDAAYRTLEEFEDYRWMARVDLNRAYVADRAEAQELLHRVAHCEAADPGQRLTALERIGQSWLDEPADPIRAVDAFKAAVVARGEAAESALLAGEYGHWMQDHGHAAEARTLFDIAWELAHTQPDLEVRIDVRMDRALLLVEVGDLDGALSELRWCVGAAKRTRDGARHLTALQNVGEVARRAEQFVLARRTLKEARELAQRLDAAAEYRTATWLLGLTEVSARKPARARSAGTELLELSEQARSREDTGHAFRVLGDAAFLDGEFEEAADWFRKASRSNDTPDGLIGDLLSIAESHAAARRWRPTLRAVQRAVDLAQEHHLEERAWPPLLRAARSYLDRNELRRAAELIGPAWALASQTADQLLPGGEDLDVDRGTEEVGGDEGSDFACAVSTTVWFVLHSGARPSDELYGLVFDVLDVEDSTREWLRSMVDEASEAINNIDEQLDGGAEGERGSTGRSSATTAVED